MPRRVAIAGGTPTWRRGVSASLTDAGLVATELAELESWRPGRGGLAVVAAISAASSLEDVRTFSEEYPHIPVVAVVPELTVSAFAEAVRAGALVAIAEDEPLEALVAVLEAALQGRAAVPGPVLRTMASRIPVAPEASAWVTPDEAEWLQRLARGATVAGLADDVGYSEREMFRMLRDTYARIGARSRTEAIIWATRHGLLDE